MLRKLYRRLFLSMTQTPVWFILLKFFAAPRPSSDNKGFVEFLRRVQYGDIILSDSRCNLTHLLDSNANYFHAGIVTGSYVCEIRKGKKYKISLLGFWKDSTRLAIVRIKHASNYAHELVHRAQLLTKENISTRVFAASEFVHLCDIENKIRPKIKGLPNVTAQAIYDGGGVDIVWEQKS